MHDTGKGRTGRDFLLGFWGLSRSRSLLVTKGLLLKLFKIKLWQEKSWGWGRDRGALEVHFF